MIAMALARIATGFTAGFTAGLAAGLTTGSATRLATRLATGLSPGATIVSTAMIAATVVAAAVIAAAMVAATVVAATTIAAAVALEEFGSQEGLGFLLARHADDGAVGLQSVIDGLLERLGAGCARGERRGDGGDEAQYSHDSVFLRPALDERQAQ
jgi:hypothetical protein